MEGLLCGAKTTDGGSGGCGALDDSGKNASCGTGASAVAGAGAVKGEADFGRGANETRSE
jgi:hypothetical protein